MTSPDDLYERHDHPELDAPALVMCLEGWIDAGLAAQTAMQAALDGLDTVPVATFDVDRLLDHRSRRPVMRLADGVSESLEWPTLELLGAVDLDGNDLLLLTGAEPDHEWRLFTSAVVGLALELNVRLVVGLGAYPAPIPHTRGSRLAATCTTEEMADQLGMVRGSLDVPAGAQATIEMEAHRHGIPAFGLWAQVPHYAAAMPYPEAAAALVRGLRDAATVTLDGTQLLEQSAATRRRLDELVANSAEHAELVRQLEHHVDEQAQAEADIPSADELAAEIQKFLRDQ